MAITIRNMSDSEKVTSLSANATNSLSAAAVRPRRCRCGGKRRPTGSRSCVTLPPDTPIENPDLAIYSQEEILGSGNVPTWDSPDIVTNDWGPFRLREEATVTIRNLSATAPAINALVHLHTSPFGIGTRQTLKTSQRVNVPRGAQIEIAFPLDRATKDGDPRVGVHVVIEHPSDRITINNSGSQVHDGAFTSESGRDFSVQIPVLNDSAFTRQFQLSVMPTELVATVSPSSFTLTPFQQIIATLSVEVPGFLSGTPASFRTREATVVGRLSSGELVGGATRLVRIDD